MKYVLGFLMLAGVQIAPWAAPHPATATGLRSAAAMVVSIDTTSDTVELRVSALGSTPVAFQVSPTCLYTGGLRSFDDLHPDFRIMVWTQAGQTGKLPVIVQMARLES